MEKPYTAVRLSRLKSKGEGDYHFRVDWHTAQQVGDPCHLFSTDVAADEGDVWALWDTGIGPGWRTYASAHPPAFMVIKSYTGEALMLDKAYTSEIREFSYTKEVTE